MRKILLPTASLLLLSVCLSAQPKTLKLNENKYSIYLPDYWGKGHKVWQVLTDKLPVICEELKDKELCGDNCNPKYRVELYVTEPGNFEYDSKKANPAPYTNTRHLGNQMVMVNGIPHQAYNPERAYYSSASNMWKITTLYDFQCYLLLMDDTGKIITRMILVDTNEIWHRENVVNMSSGGNFSDQNAKAYIENENNKEKLMPTLYEMLAIIEKKILDL
jgi:hypothetical protein